MNSKTVPAWSRLVLVIAGLLSVFIARTALAARFPFPGLSDLFVCLTVAGSLAVLPGGIRNLRPREVAAALIPGAAVGAGMLFSSLFTPYPFLNLVHGRAGQALIRGLFTSVAALGGLVILRKGGPVSFPSAEGRPVEAGKGILLGLGVGLPLAAVNVIALKFSAGRPVVWQPPGAAVLDALQPALFEEFLYRFALWGLLWLLLRRALPGKAPLVSGILAALVHNYAHFDDAFLQAPLAALATGLVMLILWGLPLLILARKKGLESAAAFHWLQDLLRFLAGF